MTLARARRLIPAFAAVLLLGCPLEDDSPPYYIGVWEFESCSGGIDGNCGGCTTNCGPERIELTTDRYVEYREGSVYRSTPASYVEGQCITGEVRPYLVAEGGPTWCLYGDHQELEACEDFFDGRCFGFRRCPLGIC